MTRALTTPKRPCTRTSCVKFGEVHERCRGHNRAGKPCGSNPIKGGFVCRLHGGSIGAVKRIATQRIALAEVNSIASRIVAFDDEYAETPSEGLLREVRWSAQIAQALGDLVESLQDDAVARQTVQGVQLNAFITMWTNERLNHARLCKLALDAGIAQQTLDIIETQAGMIVSTLVAVLTSPRLGLSSEQIIEGRVLAAEVLRAPTG